MKNDAGEKVELLFLKVLNELLFPETSVFKIVL